MGTCTFPQIRVIFNAMEKLKQARRIVVKVGTQLLTGHEEGLSDTYIRGLTCQLSALKHNGREIVLVTSGAIRAGAQKLSAQNGFSHFSSPEALKTTPQKQAAAAIGQGILIQHYISGFKEQNVVAAQVLLSRDDVADRKKYLNARNTFLALFKFDAVPVVNENDSVAVEEIVEMRFSDNDMLSALVTSLVDADALLILSDVPGFFTANPKEDPNASLIPEVKKITEELKKMAGGKGSAVSKGGMAAKLSAAQVACHSGAYTVVADGRQPEVIRTVFEGKPAGTVFYPMEPKLSSRKCWLAYCATPRGEILINDGAKNQITAHGKSLLPSGILKADGHFRRGETVRVLDEKGVSFARGIANYSQDEVNRITGKHSREIQKILGFNIADEVIHRDNLVVIK